MFSDNISANNSKFCAESGVQQLQLLECMVICNIPGPPCLQCNCHELFQANQSQEQLLPLSKLTINILSYLVMFAIVWYYLVIFDKDSIRCWMKSGFSCASWQKIFIKVWQYFASCQSPVKLYCHKILQFVVIFDYLGYAYTTWPIIGRFRFHKTIQVIYNQSQMAKLARVQ